MLMHIHSQKHGLECKNNKMHIAHIIFIVASYNLVCVLMMIVLIVYTRLVAIVTIFWGKYGLPSYQNAYIYKMEMCREIAIPIELICMSEELPGHQHSKTVEMLSVD